jgi:hypothetical protein
VPVPFEGRPPATIGDGPWIYPAKGVAGVTLMQLIPLADAKSLSQLDDFERAVYAALS